MTTSTLLRAAEELWRHGEALEAGKVLYESLDGNRRPGWVAVLDACCAGRSKVPPEIQPVREIVHSPTRWAEGHVAFQRVRKLVLVAERRRAEEGSIEYGILHLAENVAKVTYNSSGAPAPFDHDAGWWIAKNARWIVDHSSDAELEARAWTALSRL